VTARPVARSSTLDLSEPHVPLLVHRQPARRLRVRSVLLTLVACWLLVLAAPAVAHSSVGAEPAVGDAPGVTASAGDETLEAAVTDPAGDGDGGDPADRELVLGLVAIVLLAITIGLHARYRDRD
jgi:hypothetical protein